MKFTPRVTYRLVGAGGRDLGSGMKEIQDKLGQLKWLPPGTIEYGGLYQQQQESRSTERCTRHKPRFSRRGHAVFAAQDPARPAGLLRLARIMPGRAEERQRFA